MADTIYDSKPTHKNYVSKTTQDALHIDIPNRLFTGKSRVWKPPVSIGDQSSYILPPALKHAGNMFNMSKTVV
jgi:hypothetical protein